MPTYSINNVIYSNQVNMLLFQNFEILDLDLRETSHRLVSFTNALFQSGRGHDLPALVNGFLNAQIFQKDK